MHRRARLQRQVGGRRCREAWTRTAPGRPRKVASAKFDGIDGIVAAVQSGERERGTMQAALERIQAVIADVLG